MVRSACVIMSALFIVFSFVSVSKAQTIEETVSFILTKSKRNAAKIEVMDKDKCVVKYLEDSAFTLHTVYHFNNVTLKKTELTSSSRTKMSCVTCDKPAFKKTTTSYIRLRGDENIVEITHQNRKRKLRKSKYQSILYSGDRAEIVRALKYLYTNFCKSADAGS